MKRNRARVMRWDETVQQGRGKDEVRAKLDLGKQSPPPPTPVGTHSGARICINKARGDEC